MRGEVSLQASTERGLHYRAIRRFAANPELPSQPSKSMGADTNPFIGQLITHDSTVGRLFLQLKDRREEDCLYIPDIDYADDFLALQAFHGARYQSSHTDVRSQLACPILSDGTRIGVLSIESTQTSAYTIDHAAVLRRVADQIGWACYEADHRRQFSASLEPYFTTEGTQRFSSLMNQSRLMSGLDMRYILWGIDPVEGKMYAHFDRTQLPANSDPAEKFVYSFEENSLARWVLQERESKIIPDADDALESGNQWLNSKGCEYFDIHGPVVAVPLRASGHTASVLVAWSAKGQEAKLHFASVPERIRRLGHLIANDPFFYESEKPATSRAYLFLNLLDSKLKVWDKGQLWTPQLLQSEPFRAGVIDALLTLLLEDCVGLRRVRLWSPQYGKGGEIVSFRCIRSITRGDSTTKDRSRQNAYVHIVGRVKDPYVQYTMARFQGDPYARVQHYSMFGAPDKNYKGLDKDPVGSWIVAPIVHEVAPPRKAKLRGYISADTHGPSPKTGKPVEHPVSICEQRFQRYAIDVVTSVLEFVMRAEDRLLIAAPRIRK